MLLMFYDALINAHGLKYDPFKALIAPRPVGWISTVSKTGVANLAPYSFFNAVSEKPAYVVFGSAGMKDTVVNVRDTGEFVCSLATYDLRHEMNMTSAQVPPDVDEFALGGLTATKSTMVTPPRVKESPVAFECRHFQTIDLPAATPGAPAGYHMVIGLVVGIHIDERFIKDGLVDTAAMRPIARLGYMDYAVVTPESTFTIGRPNVDGRGKVMSGG
jgi:flavin reductase (DIM6/NTAB) family NADH-FMN oxidoreductase RutF